MSDNKYKELFYKSQASIADAIDELEDTLEKLKKCMLECEKDIISEKNNDDSTI